MKTRTIMICACMAATWGCGEGIVGTGDEDMLTATTEDGTEIRVPSSILTSDEDPEELQRETQAKKNPCVSHLYQMGKCSSVTRKFVEKHGEYYLYHIKTKYYDQEAFGTGFKHTLWWESELLLGVKRQSPESSYSYTNCSFPKCT